MGHLAGMEENRIDFRVVMSRLREKEHLVVNLGVSGWIVLVRNYLFWEWKAADRES